MASHDERATGMDLQKIVRLITLALAAAAVVKELRTPAEEREWNGVLGFVPYDFRIPTVARIKQRMWDPEGAHLLSPRVFGVGWTLNLGRLVELVRRRITAGA
jgi:hypothetical protein